MVSTRIRHKVPNSRKWCNRYIFSKYLVQQIRFLRFHDSVPIRPSCDVVSRIPSVHHRLAFVLTLDDATLRAVSLSYLAGASPGSTTIMLKAWERQFAEIGRAVALMGTFWVMLTLPAPLPAQQRGPMTPPGAQSSPPRSAPTSSPDQSRRPSPARMHSSSGITNEPPSLPVDQIIQKFAAREAEFRRERENYSYQQTFVIQTIDDEGYVDGEYRMSTEIVFTPEGKRYENVTYAPQPTLTRIQLSQQDLDDLEKVQPFVLTTEELPKYDIKYVGREQIDELSTYVFEVGPKTIKKNERYFQGRIWVDEKDLEIVKTDGKAVPDIKKGRSENFFPRFETYRENIEGNYWFPTYTRADDVLHFTGNDVHIRMTVRYANYKRFGVTVKIGTATEVKPEQNNPKPDRP